MTNRFRFHTKNNTSMLYDTVNEVYYFCIDLNDISDLLNELHEENEQLKNNIKEAYENERTQIGKNVLKQLIDKMERSEGAHV